MFFPFVSLSYEEHTKWKGNGRDIQKMMLFGFALFHIANENTKIGITGHILLPFLCLYEKRKDGI